MHSTSIPSVIWQRTSAVLATVVMATFGISGFVSADTITNTGPNSTNRISNTAQADCRVNNVNNVNVNSTNDQKAKTGNAKATHNTTAGDATTGNANNQNDITVKGSIDNSQAATDCVCVAVPVVDEMTAEISTTGPSSSNVITTDTTTKTDITNTNNVQISNTNHQVATTGDAIVSDNTTGGNATTGDANNHNSAGFLLNLTNPATSVVAPAAIAQGLCSPSTAPSQGGSGGGSLSTPTTRSSNFAPRVAGGRGGGFFFGSGNGNRANVHIVSAPLAPTVPAVPAVHVNPTPTFSPAAGGKGGGGSSPIQTPVSVPSASISNTGPSSYNMISDNTTNTTKVSNINNVSATNANYQTSSTGNATSVGNTSVGGSGSGAASNGNATGIGAIVTN